MPAPVTGLVVAAVAALLAGAFAVQVYRRRELPIRRRGRLAALRVATLAGVLLLLANPSLPSDEAGGPPTHWVALDASRSMAVANADGVRPWDRALDEAPSGAGVRRVRFGVEGGEGGEGPVGADPALAAPTGADSRLAPVLRRAAESGARQVSVVSDLRISDRLEAEALRDALGLDVRFVDVGGAIRSAGIAELDVPRTGRAGDAAEIRIEVFGTASAEGERAAVELLRDGSPIDTADVVLPGAGRTVAVVVETALPDSAGPVVWQARVRLAGDVFDADDNRSAVTEVDPLEGLVVLVSLEPDWEPRFLLPVLGRVTGLPTRGWFRVGDDAWLEMQAEGGVLDDDALMRVAQDARLLVVHGLTGAAPDWLVRAQAEGRRVVVFADDPDGASLAGIAAAPARPGEWYAAAANGPLAAAFTGVSWAELPPLAAPLARDSAGGALVAERAGGVRVGVVALEDLADRRRAVVLARGFWRWAFRPGMPADAYDRLWSAVAGWLLALDDGAPGGGLGPAERVAPADRPVAWWAPVAPGGRIEVTTMPGEGVPGTEATDTLEVGGDGRAELPPRAAGSYGWTARVVSPDSLAERGREWSGRLEVERHTDELRWPRDTTLLAWGGERGEVRAAGAGRPLRTSPWPWVILLALLSAEWILRRRSGLR